MFYFPVSEFLKKIYNSYFILLIYLTFWQQYNRDSWKHSVEVYGALPSFKKPIRNDKSVWEHISDAPISIQKSLKIDYMLGYIRVFIIAIFAILTFVFLIVTKYS